MEAAAGIGEASAGTGGEMEGTSLLRSAGDCSVEPSKLTVTVRGSRRVRVSAGVSCRRSSSQGDKRMPGGGGEVGTVVRPDGSDDGLA